MTQLLGAEELQSFIAYSLIPYDYASDTEVDIFFSDRFQYNLVHYLVKIKLYTYIMRMQ
jgi:hypothetical protein